MELFPSGHLSAEVSEVSIARLKLLTTYSPIDNRKRTQTCRSFCPTTFAWR